MAAVISVNDFDGDSFPAIAAEAIVAGKFVNLAGTTAKEALKVSIADTTEPIIGVAGNSAAAGEPVTVFYNGMGRMLVDGATDIAAGDPLKADGSSTGLAIKAATNLDEIGAIALEPVTQAASGDTADMARVLITPHRQLSIA